MNSAWRSFTFAALIGLPVLYIGQTPLLGQYRRPVVVPPTPVAPRATRTPIVVPPVTSYANTNPYVLPGMTLNQLALYDVLSMDPALMMNLRLYNAMYTPYRPVYVTPGYWTAPYTVSSPLYTPGYAVNPYFAAFGFYP